MFLPSKLIILKLMSWSQSAKFAIGPQLCTIKRNIKNQDTYGQHVSHKCLGPMANWWKLESVIKHVIGHIWVDVSDVCIHIYPYISINVFFQFQESHKISNHHIPNTRGNYLYFRLDIRMNSRPTRDMFLLIHLDLFLTQSTTSNTVSDHGYDHIFVEVPKPNLVGGFNPFEKY